MIGVCGHELNGGKEYCSRSCAVKAMRQRQTPERRREIARIAIAAQRNEGEERMLARCQTFGRNERERLILAYRYGKAARRTEEYRQRQAAKGRAA